APYLADYLAERLGRFLAAQRLVRSWRINASRQCTGRFSHISTLRTQSPIQLPAKALQPALANYARRASVWPRAARRSHRCVRSLTGNSHSTQGKGEVKIATPLVRAHHWARGCASCPNINQKSSSRIFPWKIIDKIWCDFHNRASC